MSGQGSTSNCSGKFGENQVAAALLHSGVPFQSQSTKYADLGGLRRLDFLAVDRKGVEWAIEVKNHSGAPGTIWQKYAYTILELGPIPARKALVLTGARHPEARIEKIRSWCQFQHVLLFVDVNYLMEALCQE